MSLSLINKTKNFKFVHLMDGVIDKERYYHLVFFIDNFEKALLNREFHYIKLEMRYLYESIWKIIENGLRENKKIQKDFGVTEYFIRAKNKRHGTISKKKHKSFSALFKDLPWRGKMEKRIYDEFCETYKKLHEYLHYNDYTVDNIRDELRYSNILLKDALDYAEFFHGILRWTMKEIYQINLDKYSNEFKPSLYNNYKPLMDNFKKNNDISEIYNTKCKICNEGVIIDPEDKTFPFGPFLQCNNKKCNSILAKNLKLKSQPLKGEVCPNEKCSGEIKEVYNYAFKKKYKSCNLCSYNTRNNIENILDMDEIISYWNSDDKYKNIEEMYNVSKDKLEDEEE